ncbi:MAG TPA: hypothetical protein VFV05_06425 [Methylomirabilota bacterium]|nr:hypothetical protein [Methylomirabilota bacterium]
MRPRHLALVMVLVPVALLMPALAYAELKIAAINVKGMVCQA